MLAREGTLSVWKCESLLCPQNNCAGGHTLPLGKGTMQTAELCPGGSYSESNSCVWDCLRSIHRLALNNYRENIQVLLKVKLKD
jgi:hypothetical protein